LIPYARLGIPERGEENVKGYVGLVPVPVKLVIAAKLPARNKLLVSQTGGAVRITDWI